MPRAAILAIVTTLAVSAIGACANAATTEDRYGPPPPDAEAGAPTAGPVSGWLSWSKTKEMQSDPSQAILQLR